MHGHVKKLCSHFLITTPLCLTPMEIGWAAPSDQRLSGLGPLLLEPWPVREPSPTCPRLGRGLPEANVSPQCPCHPFPHSPNHACCSPSTSMARPKSASFTAAPLSLEANNRFSGFPGPEGRVKWGKKEPEDSEQTQNLSSGRSSWTIQRRPAPTPPVPATGP